MSAKINKLLVLDQSDEAVRKTKDNPDVDSVGAVDCGGYLSVHVLSIIVVLLFFELHVYAEDKFTRVSVHGSHTSSLT